jgi:hypothetical protein
VAATGIDTGSRETTERAQSRGMIFAVCAGARNTI